jgi:hypothetical protein
MALFRRRRMPAELRPPLAADERVVAWCDSDSGAVTATNLGLWLPSASRLGWHEIHKAVWDGATLVVTPSTQVADRAGYQVVADLAPVTLRLRDPGELPHQVRARVTRSVGYSGYHRLPGGGGLRVAARRVPGVDGLRWTVRFDPGVDLDDPAVALVTDGIVEQVRA